jgi:hypothetical protein
MAHRDSVVYCDGVELERDPAGLSDRGFHDLAELMQVNVTWHYVDL